MGGCHTGEMVDVDALDVEAVYDGDELDDFLSAIETSPINPNATAMTMSHGPREPLPVG